MCLGVLETSAASTQSNVRPLLAPIAAAESPPGCIMWTSVGQIGGTVATRRRCSGPKAANQRESAILRSTTTSLARPRAGAYVSPEPHGGAHRRPIAYGRPVKAFRRPCVPFCAAWPMQSAVPLTIARLFPLHTSSPFSLSSDQAKGAILALKDRTGSSLQAIKKYLNIAPDKNRFLNAGLAAGVKSGVLVKNKGSYKVAQAAKKAAPKKKKPAAKKKKATKVRGVCACGLCGRSGGRRRRGGVVLVGVVGSSTDSQLLSLFSPLHLSGLLLSLSPLQKKAAPKKKATKKKTATKKKKATKKKAAPKKKAATKKKAAPKKKKATKKKGSKKK